MFVSPKHFRLAAILSLVVGVAAVRAQEDATTPAEPAAPTVQSNDQAPQRGRGQQGFDRMLGVVPLLRIETVREELGVDEEQSKTLETVTLEIREDFGGQLRDFFMSLRDLSPEERRARRQEGDGKLAEIRAKIDERLQGVLNEGQFHRLKEIEVQRLVRTNGVGALTGGDLAAALDLTDEQKQQLRDQAEASRGPGEAISLDEVRAKVKEILTPDQMGKLDTLFGEAFDLPQELLQRGPGRFRGGPGGQRDGRFDQRGQQPDSAGEVPAANEANPE
jgi:hypothetical protein